MSKLKRSSKCPVLPGFLRLGGLVALATVGFATPAQAQAVVATGVGTPFELAFWQSIDSSSDPALYEAYLARFPSGTFGEIARAKILVLHGRTVPPAAPAALASATPVLTVPVLPPPSVAPLPTPAGPAPMAYAQPEIAGPAAVAAPPPAIASATPASANGTLGQLLAALASSQVSSGSPVAPAPAAAQLATVQPAPRTGFAVPQQPALSPVGSVTLPQSFCSAEARNAFHDTVYAPAVNAAKQNNDAAAAYMRQLQSLYDQYQLSHDGETSNAIVGAARTYQQVAQTTFSMQAALVRQFSALMAVPLVPCAQPQITAMVQ